VLNAHRASDASGEGFAVRLFRGANARGFVRALTDQPTALAAGFAKAERVLKALYVRRLHLWPRFAAQVKETLDDLGTAARLCPFLCARPAGGGLHGVPLRAPRRAHARAAARFALRCSSRACRLSSISGETRCAHQEVDSAWMQAVPKQPQAAGTGPPCALAHAIACTRSEKCHRLR
jgi:hypothetical protein